MWAGTQWKGTINAGDSQQWFTWGWPASWHVVWYLMPIASSKQAGPQLEWEVSVERSNVSQCTYWITVKNLTGAPVEFEGRFDVLSA